MGAQISVRELMERLEAEAVVVVRGISWHVVGVRQQADRSDGTMQTKLMLTRQEKDGTPRRLTLDVELSDMVRLAD